MGRFFNSSSIGRVLVNSSLTFPVLVPTLHVIGYNRPDTGHPVCFLMPITTPMIGLYLT